MITTKIYMNDEPLNLIKSDGLIIATSTGSTAYSLSAGGTIIHYDVDCLLLNAICPHSLSFRSIAFPREIKLTVILHYTNKPSWVNYDGQKKFPLKAGQGVEVSLSDNYVNFIVLENLVKNRITLWKQKIVDQLGWNSSFKNMEGQSAVKMNKLSLDQINKKD
jgi:NAD+ kinase